MNNHVRNFVIGILALTVMTALGAFDTVQDMFAVFIIGYGAITLFEFLRLEEQH